MTDAKNPIYWIVDDAGESTYELAISYIQRGIENRRDMCADIVKLAGFLVLGRTGGVIAPDVYERLFTRTYELALLMNQLIDAQLEPNVTPPN